MKIYGIHIDDAGSIPATYIGKLMPIRRRKAARYLRREDRLRCIGAGYLIHSLLSCDETALRYGEYGKPYLPGGPEFSISHGGNWTVMALDSAPVGIDIEPIAPGNLTVARRVFTADELEWMACDPEQRFHILWTLKESLMKAVGLGLQLDPISFSALPIDKPHTLCGSAWHTSYILHDGCAIACASAAIISGLEFERIAYPL